MDENIDLKLQRWYSLAKQLKKVKEEEMALRIAIRDMAFPQLKEGANSFEFKPGWVLKNTHKLNRTIDETVLEAVRGELPHVAFNNLIQWKPELRIKHYRELTETDRQVFDEALVIKPGSPAFTIVEKKK